MARRKSRLLRNGRNAGSTAFLMLEHYVFDCVAYRTMKPGPRALLDELIRRHNGSNNGRVGLGVRAAGQALNVSKDTASAYFEALIERGFIAVGRPGGFNLKDPQSRRASEWRLTWIKTDWTAATKDFIAWSKKSTAPKSRTACPRNPDRDGPNDSNCPKNPDLSTRSRCSVGPENQDTYISGHGRAAVCSPLGWWKPDSMQWAGALAIAAALAGEPNQLLPKQRQAA